MAPAPRVPSAERPPLSRWLSPAPTSRVARSKDVRLRWRPSHEATFYNVQVFVRGRKVTSAWPARPSLMLPAGTVGGGAFRVVVWVASGPRAAPRFQPRPWLVQAIGA